MRLLERNRILESADAQHFRHDPKVLSNLDTAHTEIPSKIPSKVNRDPPNRTLKAIPLPTILPEKPSSCRVQRDRCFIVGIAERIAEQGFAFATSCGKPK